MPNTKNRKPPPIPGLPKQRQEIFARHMAAGYKQKEAAILACFPPASASARASQLMAQPDVKTRVEQIRSSIKEQSISSIHLSKSLVLNELWKNVQRASGAHDNSSVNRGLELIGKELGMFVDRKIVGVQALIAELTPENLRAASTLDLVRLVGTLESVMVQNEQKSLPASKLNEEVGVED